MSNEKIRPEDLATMEARLKDRTAAEAASLTEKKVPAVTPDFVSQCVLKYLPALLKVAHILGCKARLWV